MSFKNHEVSACHREAVEVCVTLPATCEHIGEQLSTQFAEENKSNRKMLIKILSCLQLLARQGLAIRGDGDECDAYFIQLFKFLGQDDVVTRDRWICAIHRLRCAIDGSIDCASIDRSRNHRSIAHL